MTLITAKPGRLRSSPERANMKFPCSPYLVVAILVHQQVNAFTQLFGCFPYAAYYAANTAPPCILHGDHPARYWTSLFRSFQALTRERHTTLLCQCHVSFVDSVSG